MRISDWSSDVCSSDLVRDRAADEARDIERVEAPVADLDTGREIGGGPGGDEVDRAAGRVVPEQRALRSLQYFDPLEVERGQRGHEIGRASWRERVCQYV